MVKQVIGILAFFAFTSVGWGIEVLPPSLVAERITVEEHTLVRVKLNDNERVFVTRSFSNGEVDFIETEFWADISGNIIGKVWTGSPGSYSLIVVPEDRTQEPRYMIVTIKGDKPDPEPEPDPEPDPDPKPIPIPNKYEVGQLAFDLASALGDKEAAKMLSVIYFAAASQLAALPDDPIRLIEQINSAYLTAHNETNTKLNTPERLERWAPFRNEMKKAIENTWKKGFTTKQDAVNILNELATALEAVSK